MRQNLEAFNQAWVSAGTLVTLQLSLSVSPCSRGESSSDGAGRRTVPCIHPVRALGLVLPLVGEDVLTGQSKHLPLATL